MKAIIVLASAACLASCGSQSGNTVAAEIADTPQEVCSSEASYDAVRQQIIAHGLFGSRSVGDDPAMAAATSVASAEALLKFHEPIVDNVDRDSQTVKCEVALTVPTAGGYLGDDESLEKLVVSREAGSATLRVGFSRALTADTGKPLYTVPDAQVVATAIFAAAIAPVVAAEEERADRAAAAEQDAAGPATDNNSDDPAIAAPDYSNDTDDMGANHL